MQGVDGRNQAEEEEFRQTEDKLRASQEALARKAALYEKLSKGQPLPPDAKGSFLVDFKKKVLRPHFLHLSLPDSPPKVCP